MAGFYVHIPFCAKKCSYCDFHFSTHFESYRDEMVKSIAKEIISRKREASSPLLSIYFGGGTPSLLTAKELSFLLNTIHQHYTVDNCAEITLEANPEDVSFESLREWQEAGVNRLSVGLQSFKPSDLEWMNRGHSAAQTIKCIENASTGGFKDISIDLMYGLPGLTIKEWASHLEQVVYSNITHVSAYCLTVEKGTKLEREVKKGRRIVPEDDIIEQQYKLLVSKLKSAGFEQYEVSNFARHNKYSKHNSAYWKGISYIGVGPSAHSFRVGYRRWNVSNNTRYIKNIKDLSRFHDDEFLCDKDVWNELFLTGLRTRWGVSKKAIESLGGFSKKEKALLKDYITKGKIKEDAASLRLEGDAFLFADGVAKDFFRTS